MTSLLVKKNWISQKFKPVLTSKDRYLIAYGGRGSGKTNHIILKLLSLTFLKDFVNIYYCRHEFETIRKTTFKDIKNYLKNRPELAQYFIYSDSVNGSMTFKNTLTGNELTPFGLDDPEKTKGISEATVIWIDELDKCTFQQFSLINDTLRTPKAEFLQFIGSFNPTSDKSWIRSHFFDEKDISKSNPKIQDSILIHHSTVKDNEYIDVDAYIRTLQMSYMGNDNALNVNLYGLWGHPENEAPWLYAFGAEKHVKKLSFLPKFPVYLSFDFNREPMTCIVAQRSTNLSGVNSFLHIIKEYKGNWQLSELCERIKIDFAGSVLFVTGDSAGNKGDVGFDARNQTYYTIIQRLLGLTRRQMHLNRRNLTHNDSRILCNVMFNNYNNFYIDESCTGLIHDCQIAEVDTKSNTAGAIKKDRGVFKMDLFDGLRYLLQTYYHDFANQVYLKIKKIKKAG